MKIIADDGKEFEKVNDCIAYEMQMEFNRKKKLFELKSGELRKIVSELNAKILKFQEENPDLDFGLSWHYAENGAIQFEVEDGICKDDEEDEDTMHWSTILNELFGDGLLK